MAAIKLSTTLIVVIAVSALVGCILLLFLFFRCCRRPKSAPLPPIQPLAHYREKDSTYLPRPHTIRNSLGPNQLVVYESDSSLLKPSGKPSFQTDGSDATPSSSNHSFSTFPSPQTNVTASPRSADDEQTWTAQQYVPTTRQARSVSRATGRPRSRVISSASTNTTFAQVSPRPTSIIRGPPHSSLSSVQIVLPAPLAPQLQNYMVEGYPILDQDASLGQRTSWHSGQRSRRSSDTNDQRRRSISQTQPRGRTVSDRSLPSQSASTEQVPPLPSLDNETRPPTHDGQAG